MSELEGRPDAREQVDSGEPRAIGEKPRLSDLYADDPDDIFDAPPDPGDDEDSPERWLGIDHLNLPDDKPVRYGLDATVRDGALVRTRLFEGEPKREQAIQGNLYDCSVIACLGAVAGHKPETIRELVGTREDGTYEVRLHEAAFRPDGVCQPTGQRIHMAVTPDLPVNVEKPYRAEFAQTYQTGAAWPAILEKAIAAVDETWSPERQSSRPERGYDRLNLGTQPHDQAELLTLLTGQPAAAHRIDTAPGNESTVEAWLRDRLDHHAPVIVSTRQGEDEGQLAGGLVGLHAYEVVGVNDGKILLRNPWGYAHPPPLATRDFLDSIRPLITTLYEQETQA